MIRDAYSFAAPPIVLGLLAAVLGSLGEVVGWQWIAGVFLFLGLFVLYFFRDPERTPPSDVSAIVSPADGRVVEIAEEPFEGAPGWRISIFLSVWDVHVNRSPFAGRVTRVDYRPGRFYAALRARASAENEQNVIYLHTARGQIVFKQIAGWIARRVICWKLEGSVVSTGERIGMIRFGSRADVWLPRAVEISCRRGQHVAGGTTILARWV